MGIASKYTKKQIQSMDKKAFMREANFDEMFCDFGFVFNVMILCRESTAHEEQVRALQDQVDRMVQVVQGVEHFHLVDNGVIIEDAKSGLNAEIRPKFKAAIERAVSDDIDVIIVQEASRFSRSVSDFFVNKDILESSGVGLIVLDGEFWTYHMRPSDIPRLAAEVSKAEAESLTTSKRVGRGIETYMQRGQLVCGNMFGYDLVKAVERKDNTLKINPVDGATVQLIFDKYVREGLGTDLIATYLNVNHYPTYSRKGEWSASKIRRVLMNEKYAGLILYGKFKTIDTRKKKKIATHIEAVRETIYDSEGSVLQERNVTHGTWEPLVDEDIWWKAQEIRKNRSLEFKNSPKGNMLTGLRSSNDAYANKSYCCCGYTMSPQYVHVATETKPAQFRYMCRQQINAHTPAYREKHGLPPSKCTCSLSAVSDVAMRLMSIKVFRYLFTDIRDTLDETLELIEQASKQAKSSADRNGVAIEDLEAMLEKLSKRLDKYVDLYADEELSKEIFQKKKVEIEEEIKRVKELINDRRLAIAKEGKRVLDVENIRKRLEMYVNLSGFGVSDEMIEFFVERIIHRPNNEFLWEINLSGEPSTPSKYKISEYSKNYENALKDDSNFNIVKTFVIPLEECKEFCTTRGNRQFRAKSWNQITVKIAVK